MPKVASFRANSVIYFEGDVSDKIFVLQKGRVTLKYTDIETGADVATPRGPRATARKRSWSSESWPSPPWSTQAS